MQHKQLRFIIILSFLVVILLGSLYFIFNRNKTIEGFESVSVGNFTKSVLRNEFGDSSCQVLDDTNLTGDGKLMARQYIQGNRIRKYKPLDDKINDDNKCYINYDTSNEAKDYLLSGRTCSKEDPFFQDVEFIKDAYLDNGPDKTNDASYRKCVFEVDPSKVTTQSLQDFWDSVGTSDCIQLNRDIVENNKSLKEKLMYNTNLFDKQNVQYNDILTLLEIQKATIQDLESEITSLAKFIDEKQKDYELTTQDKSTLDNNFKTIDASFKKQLQDLSKKFKDVTTKYNETLQIYKTLYDEYSKLTNENSSLEDKFNTLKRNHELVSGYVNQLTKENNSILDKYNNLLVTIVQLDRNTAICKDYNESCQILSDCRLQLSELNQDIDNLRNIVEQTRRAINDSLSAKQNYDNLYNDCMSDIGKLNATLTSQYAEIERLKNMHVGDCKIQQDKIQELQNYRDDLDNRCKPYIDRANMNMNSQNNLESQKRELDNRSKVCSAINDANDADQLAAAIKAVKVLYAMRGV